MFIDSFYTPKTLADKLVSFIKKDDYKTVADFCVGDGELLRAALDRWPEIRCFGSDISDQAINLVNTLHEDWQLSLVDFLDVDSREQSSILKMQASFDLILLNPPFSCVGGTVHEVEFENETFQVSTAMKFLVTSLKYLAKNGVLYAILPTSIAYSQKDKYLWAALEKSLNLAVLDEPRVQYFKGCAPSVILVSVNDFHQQSKLKSISRITLDFERLSVFRGKLSMNLVEPDPNGRFLVHSTNIYDYKINDLELKVNRPLSEVTGPAVLIPRVGKPIKDKLCVINVDETYALSDCIIAIKAKSLADCIRLQQYITDNWDAIKEMYKGTGARYITLDKLSQFLNLDSSEIRFEKRAAV